MGLLGLTGFHWALLGFDWVSIGFDWVLPSLNLFFVGSTGFHLVLLGSTRFYCDVPSFAAFAWVATGSLKRAALGCPKWKRWSCFLLFPSSSNLFVCRFFFRVVRYVLLLFVRHGRSPRPALVPSVVSRRSDWPAIHSFYGRIGHEFSLAFHRHFVVLLEWQPRRPFFCFSSFFWFFFFTEFYF